MLPDVPQSNTLTRSDGAKVTLFPTYGVTRTLPKTLTHCLLLIFKNWHVLCYLLGTQQQKQQWQPQRHNKNKKLHEGVRQQKQQQDVSELSVLGTLLFSGSTTPVSSRCREESSSRRHYICKKTHPVSLTAQCIQSLPFAFTWPRPRGIQWGTKIKKNPGNNKNNADRQRFGGGSVQTDPPFDYLACANPAQTVKLSFLLNAITDCNA